MVEVQFTKSGTILPNKKILFEIKIFSGFEKKDSGDPKIFFDYGITGAIFGFFRNGRPVWVTSLVEP